ncbi:cupin domain-containing protein [Flavobacterium cupreum]|uniref:Cupin domain-containing protein n=1 Tax=Flavobacterium cupreum TaxID=2133766 RepID=A0A434A4H6_9FLAO|nr:cupin domain-containing protein [Flavobacterium cupreum]RUT69242.1 cupin domain-containing protein [Flavobacterium cupreum]
MTTENNDTLFPKGNKLPNDWFSGEAFLTALIARDKNNEFSAGSVSFDAKARTNWHTHPKGQVLLVTEGQGYYQEKNQPAKIIKKGDVINIPEDVEHWHGASENTNMTHIAITNYKDDLQVTWLQVVTDEEYQSAIASISNK